MAAGGRRGDQILGQIRIVGDPIEVTGYGDGYDAGDILVYDVPTDGGEDAIDPAFALVVDRDANDLTLLTLGSVSRKDDVRCDSGTRVPVHAAFVIGKGRRETVGTCELGYWPVPIGRYVTASLADGTPTIMGCELLPWDGRPVRYAERG